MFSVRWGTDEDGRLVPVDTREARRISQPAALSTAVCPPGSGPGQTVEVEVGDQRVLVTVPAGIAPGDTFQVLVGDQGAELSSGLDVSREAEVQAPVTVGDVAERIRRLQTPMTVQVLRRFLLLSSERSCATSWNGRMRLKRGRGIPWYLQN